MQKFAGKNFTGKNIWNLQTRGAKLFILSEYLIAVYTLGGKINSINY